MTPVTRAISTMDLASLLNAGGSRMVNAAESRCLSRSLFWRAMKSVIEVQCNAVTRTDGNE
jgi:hypothetical protein